MTIDVLYKRLISDLDFFITWPRSVSDLYSNPVLQWWYEYDFNRDFVNVFFRNPPSHALPLSDTEILSTLIYAEWIHNRSIDPRRFPVNDNRPVRWFLLGIWTTTALACILVYLMSGGASMVYFLSVLILASISIPPVIFLGTYTRLRWEITLPPRFNITIGFTLALILTAMPGLLTPILSIFVYWFGWHDWIFFVGGLLLSVCLFTGTLSSILGTMRKIIHSKRSTT